MKTVDEIKKLLQDTQFALARMELASEFVARNARKDNEYVECLRAMERHAYQFQASIRTMEWVLGQVETPDLNQLDELFNETYEVYGNGKG